MQNSEHNLRNKITLLSFGCSLLVIWIHTYNLEVYGITENASGFSYILYCIEKFWANITQIAVPMFFFISGFLFFRNFSWNKLRDKYASRIRSIVIPYVCWCTLYYIYFVILSKIPFASNIIGEEAMVTLSLDEWIKALWAESYYVLWFLKNLMKLYLMTILSGLV